MSFCCETCDDVMCEGTATEAEELLITWKSEIRTLIEQMEKARPLFQGSSELYVVMYDDQLKDMKEVLTKLINFV